MGRSVLSPPVANIPDFDAKLLSDLAGRLAAVTPMVHYRTLKLFGITFPRFAPFGAAVLVHNSLVSDPTNRVQFFGGRANSGLGSYDKLAEFKAEVLNGFVKENTIKSVIEYGCGDGNQLKFAEYPSYLGFDVSVKA